MALSTAEAAALLATDGPNRLVPDRRGSRIRKLLEPLLDPMVILLLVAAPTYFAIGHTSDGVVTVAALVPIAAVSWVLERRAEKSLEQLRRLTAPMARVTRDGIETEVTAESVVVGDLLGVHEGDIVPADATVGEVTQLHVDESALTGESLPVAKSAGDVLLAGTTVLSGRATATVFATGPRTRYGEVGSLIARASAPTTPLQRAVRRLVLVFGAVAVVFCAIVIIVEVARGRGWASALIAGVSLAIAAVPEEFPMVYTLYLALGARRLSRERALVRNLPGVETLGSTTVICTDKTGTLTHGRLEVAATAFASSNTEVELLRAAVLACEPDPYDPLDVAIVAYAHSIGIDTDALLSNRMEADHPFDPVDKYLTHLWVLADGSRVVAAKGAVEGILAHSSLPESQRTAALAENAAFATAGMRVIAIASGVNNWEHLANRAAHEADLRYLGLVAFSDTVRLGVFEALAECRTAGIRVVMITGDHPVTAHAVAEGLHLPHTSADGDDIIVTGSDLDAADDVAFDLAVSRANVFARIRPEQKHRLVRALRAHHEVVAMTGDGINDAPALREADIGVAMGMRGTAVARESATLVLLDDNFATIVTAVRDGRRIFDNLRRAFSYLIAFHIPLLLSALLIPFIGKPLLLLPIHLVLLEIVLHPAVSLVFEADVAARDTMQRPPRPPATTFIDRSLWRPLLLGLTLTGATLGVYLGTITRHWPEQEARGTAFCLLLVGQMFLLAVERSPERPLWRGPAPTRTLWWVLALFAVAIVSIAYIGPIARLLTISPPSPLAWLLITGLAAAATLWSEPAKARFPR
ncbi:MAG: HAD-IC family P-type ATPase [Actinobacteria bacterium]|uniref:Unannotated protein n=1 Tax=freshwater metagenome TaxID=449393 RepID=A0A6J6QHZ2_9ZZZZ|nr:HAD-IC family P-type ATPase [Actinomycetota bacterium]